MMAELTKATSTYKTQELRSYYPWLIYIIAATFYCYEYCARVAPSVMTEELMIFYGLTATSVGNLIAFYYYAYAPMQLAVGVLFDRFSPRYLLAGSCLCCAVGAYLFAAPPGQLYLAMFGRFLIGFGSAFAFVGTLKLATLWLPANRFALISGLTTTLGMLGAMFGDSILSGLIQHTGWRQTIIYSAVLGLGVTLVIWLVIRDRPQSIYSHTPSKKPSLTASFAALYSLLKQPHMWINGIIGCLLFLPLSAFAELWGIPYMQGAHHYSNMEAVHAISMIFLGWAIGSPVSGFISDKLCRRRMPLIIGSVLTAIVLAILLYIPHLSLNTVYSLLFLLGLFSSVEVITFAVAREMNPDYYAGTSVAFTNMLVMFGGLLFQPFLGALLDQFWSGQINAHGVRIYTPENYKYAMSVIPLMMIGSALLAYLIPETYARPYKEKT